MKRLVVLLAVIIGAAAGAFAQSALPTETQPSPAVVQEGVLYNASFCTGDPSWQYGSRPEYSFLMRPIRLLSDGWVEAEVANRLTQDHLRSYQFVPDKKLTRLNLRQICEISVTEIPR